MTKVSGALVAAVGVVLGGVGVLVVPYAVPLVLWSAVIAAAVAYRVAAVVPVRILGLAGSRRSVRAAGAGAAVLVACAALAGLVVLVGGVLAVLVAAAVALLVWRGERRRDAEPPAQAPAQPPAQTDARRQPSPGPAAPALPVAVAAMSTAQLCRAWRISYLALHNTGDADTMGRVAAARRCYLDEMERRDPRGFRRWIDSGARAAGDPLRFIGADGRDAGDARGAE